MFGERASRYARPSVRHPNPSDQNTAEPKATERTWWPWPDVAAVPGHGPDRSAAARPGGQPGWASDAECMCGRVCVCQVPAGVVRSVASFVAEWHPTAVFDGSPAAERAEDATLCRCGQAFCGYRIFARTMRRAGAFIRA